MQGRSAAFDATVSKPHRAVSRADVIQDGKVVAQLTAAHTGSVTADRTAAQMRSFEVELSDPDGSLTPEGMGSLLAPFGTRLLISKGARISSVAIQAAFYGTPASWVPSGNSTGVFSSTLVDPSDGSLTLGPASATNRFPSPSLYPSSTTFPY